jgi:hypothetical protein
MFGQVSIIISMMKSSIPRTRNTKEDFLSSKTQTIEKAESSYYILLTAAGTKKALQFQA